jgi:hypothetical protein
MHIILIYLLNFSFADIFQPRSGSRFSISQHFTVYVVFLTGMNSAIENFTEPQDIAKYEIKNSNGSYNHPSMSFCKEQFKLRVLRHLRKNVYYYKIAALNKCCS